MGVEFTGKAGQKTQMVILPLYNFCLNEIFGDDAEKIETIMDLSRTKEWEDTPSDVQILYPDDQESKYRLFVQANLNKGKDRQGHHARKTLFELASLIGLHVSLMKLHYDGDISYIDEKEHWKGKDVSGLPEENLEYIQVAYDMSQEVVDNFMNFANQSVQNLFA